MNQNICKKRYESPSLILSLICDESVLITSPLFDDGDYITKQNGWW